MGQKVDLFCLTTTRQGQAEVSRNLGPTSVHGSTKAGLAGYVIPPLDAVECSCSHRMKPTTIVDRKITGRLASKPGGSDV